MQKSGVRNCLFADYKTHQGKYDTILVLMNGLGLAGKLNEVPSFLNRCLSLLNPGGQLLFDSSDISYLYEEGLVKPAEYYGELRYQYQYGTSRGDWFDWVYVDQKTLKDIASSLNLQLEILYTEDTDQYLARMAR
jgi:hypothetical protein